MVKRSKKLIAPSVDEEQSGSSSDTTTFAPRTRQAAGRKKRKAAVDEHISESDSEEAIAVPDQRRRRTRRDRIETAEALDVPRRGSRRSQRRRVETVEPEDRHPLLGGSSEQDCTDSDESFEDGGGGRRDGRRRPKRTRRNAKVLEAVWTPKRTVRITYDIGMKHACMNPIHGKATNTYTVLHLVKCTWKKNVRMMTDELSTARSKPYQYCHKLCQPCLDMNGNRCFKCSPADIFVSPILHTLFGTDSVTCVDDFKESVDRWMVLRQQAEAAYMVVHCTIVGPEARDLRQRFSLKRSTRIHIVYSDVRDKMNQAGSGINLEESAFQHVWRTIMKEKVPGQDSNSMVAFNGNILLNESLSFKDFRTEDLLVLYERNIFDRGEEDAIRVCINALHIQSLPYMQDAPSECGLLDAVVHTHREPTSPEEDCVIQHGDLLATWYYKAVKRHFSQQVLTEFDHRAALGEAFRIGDEGQKLPFRKLYAARGGEVRFRSVSAPSTHDLPRRDARSRVCGWDTSSFELVCWTQRGQPMGGDFVIPGLMYRFETSPGSCLIFRPSRYFHATLPTHNRDLKNEKFAAAFVTSA